jgi:transcription elongation factor Elf1
MKTQLELQQQILEIDINIVTCGNCSSVILHEVHQYEIECHICGYKSEPCEFPDLNFDLNLKI